MGALSDASEALAEKRKRDADLEAGAACVQSDQAHRPPGLSRALGQALLKRSRSVVADYIRNTLTALSTMTETPFLPPSAGPQARAAAWPAVVP